MSVRMSRTSCCGSSRPPTSTSPVPSGASSTSTRSTRSPARRTTPRSLVTSPGRACSRACSRSSRAPSPTSRRRAVASIPHQDFIQIDTTNILFILGGAFEGLEKIVEERVGHKSMGFGSQAQVDSVGARQGPRVAHARGPPEVRAHPRVRGPAAGHGHPLGADARRPDARPDGAAQRGDAPVRALPASSTRWSSSSRRAPSRPPPTWP